MRWPSSLGFRRCKRCVKLFAVITFLITGMNVFFSFGKTSKLMKNQRTQYNTIHFMKDIVKNSAIGTQNAIRNTVDLDTIAREGFPSLNKSKCFTDGKMNETFREEMFFTHRVNVCVSDTVDLNRQVPDSRPSGCSTLTYGENLLSTSVIVTFYDEWPSVLLRTIHSIINRTPSKWLHEIVLVDDASTMGALAGPKSTFLENLRVLFTSGDVSHTNAFFTELGLHLVPFEGLKTGGDLLINDYNLQVPQVAMVVHLVDLENYFMKRSHFRLRNPIFFKISSYTHIQESLKDNIDSYLDLFPRGLIKMVRLHERRGLIQARLAGIANATGDVIAIFDSHMEVNHYWLEPLVAEIVKDRKTIAMATLDYVENRTFKYKFFPKIPRYGFNWQLTFYENKYWRDPAIEHKFVRPGVVTVGTGFALRRDYFYEIGGYDEKMNIWGAENLELSWRVWLCGGRMVHVICSCIGHIARLQPYSFPGGRGQVTRYNYKRAVEVWMEPNHRELVYSNFPAIKDLDTGDLTERLELKSRLKCKPFSWFINNVWPDLGVLNENTTAWGRSMNVLTNTCLDTKGEYGFGGRKVEISPCVPFTTKQGFSITKTGLLRTQLHCVQYNDSVKAVDKRPYLGDCLSGPQQIWLHEKDGYLKHQISGLCLEVKNERALMRQCDAARSTQKWRFDHYAY